jgi:PAS domain S-box-containing protein
LMEDRIQKKINNLNYRARFATIIFNLIVIPLILVYYLVGKDLQLHIGIAGFLIINTNYLLYRRLRAYEIWTNVNLIAIAFACWFGFYTGDQDNTGILWALTFPVWAYGLKSASRANVFVSLFFAVLILIYILSIAGYLSLDYDHAFLAMYFLVLATITYFLSINSNRRESGEKILVENSLKYETILNHLTIGVVMLDRNLKVIEANRCARNWFPSLENDYLSGRIIHANSDETILPDDFPAKKTFEDGQVRIVEREKTNGDILKVFRILTKPMKDLNNRIFAVLEIIEDITEKKLSERLLQESETTFKALSQYSSSGIFLYRDNRFLMVNPALSRITGYSLEKLMSMSDWEMVHPDYRDLMRSSINEDIRDDDFLMDYELKLMTRSGEDRWVDYSVTRINISGKPTIIGTMVDITERKWAEETLEYEQHLMSLLMDNVPYQIFFKDMNSRFIRLNKSISKRFGLKHPGEAIGKTDFDIFTPEHAQQAYDDEQSIIRTGKPIIDKEEKETWTDGSISWVSTTKMPFLDHKGKLVGTFGISKDITELKQALNELGASEEKYRLITENAMDVIWIYNLSQNKFTYISPSVKQLRGYTSEETMLQSLDESLTPESREMVERVLKNALKELKSNPETVNIQRISEIQQPCKDGSVVWVEASTQLQYNANDEIEILGVSRNITGRKKMEEDIQYKNQMQQLVSLVSSEFLSASLKNIDQNIIHVLQYTGEFFNMDRANVFQYTADGKYFSLTHEWCANGIKPSHNYDKQLAVEDFTWWNKTLMLNEPVFIKDVASLPDVAKSEKLEFASQDIKSLICFPVLIDGRITGFYGLEAIHQMVNFSSGQISVMRLIANIISDSLERNKAEKALAISERNSREAAIRYQAFIEASNTGAWEHDNENDSLWCSPQYFGILGWDIDEFRIDGKDGFNSQTWINLLHPDDRDHAVDHLNNYLKHEQGTYQQIFRMLHKNGDYRWILSRGRILEDEDGNPTSIIVGTHIDITEQKRAEETIKAKNKELESYLYVTSHDLRSPLVNIQGFSNRIQRHIEKLSQVEPNMNTAEDAKPESQKILMEEVPKSLSFIFSNVKKMDNLINGLLTISRTGRVKMKIEKVDMNTLISRIVDLNNFKLEQSGAHLTIEKLGGCFGDANLLNQLFSNLIDNSLKYRKREVPLEIHISSVKRNSEIVYSLTDNGIGIPEDRLEKIWDVFYRVDPASAQEGDGIGLNIVSKIVEKHQGEIWVESSLEKGTSFFVKLNTVPFDELAY